MNDSTFFERRNGELFRSTDTGKNWTQLNNILPYLGNIVMSGSVLYASGNYCIARSTDNGNNWKIDTLGLAVDTSDPNTRYESQTPPLVVSGGNVLTVIQKQASPYTGVNVVFKLTNSQQQWTSVGTFTDGPLNFSAASNLVVAEPFSSSGGVQISTDNGNSWNSSGPIVPNYRSINSVAAIGTTVLAGSTVLSNGGLYLSTNGGNTWSDTSLLYNPECLSVISGNIIAGTDGGIAISSNNGSSWSYAISPCSKIGIDWLAADGSNVFAGNYGSLIHSTNGGITWAIPDSSTFINLHGLAVSDHSVFA
jgi:photosystem II stability/assembly factor-like uncharacterized protein